MTDLRIEPIRLDTGSLPKLPVYHSSTKRPSWYQFIIGLFQSKGHDFKPTFSAEFNALRQKLPQRISRHFESRLFKVNRDEHYVGNYLRSNIDADSDELAKIFAIILQGGYIAIDDKGDTFNDWQANLDTLVKRDSSHDSSGQVQYAFRGRVVGEFLFSTKIINKGLPTEKTVTWMQLERYPLKFGFITLHMWGWVLYKITAKNQGPYGASEYREANPYFVKLKPTYSKL